MPLGSRESDPFPIPDPRSRLWNSWFDHNGMAAWNVRRHTGREKVMCGEACPHQKMKV